MGWDGLERNKLDYILTDVLPVELSELFSFSRLYSFLLRKKNQKILNKIIETIKINKAKNKEIFKSGWSSKPLKYTILKGSNSLRKMSVIQPLSALNLYLFIECYKKDIIHYFEKKHIFSIRYHRTAVNLYYKVKQRNIAHYFQKQSIRTGRGVVQQAGNFFKIAPFESLNAFIDSRHWRISNFEYKYYAKIDYKSCFDSIYTHAFTWIIERNTIDAKEAHNSNLFIIIDRILQNINGRFSNGIVVGPEFSRMAAEILLQHIDREVFKILTQKNIIHKTDYTLFRYVDDIFIFANQPSTISTIVETYKLISEKFLLRLNELKFEQGETPCISKDWLEKTRQLADIISNFFYKEKEYKSIPDEERYLVKRDFIHIDRIKDEVAVLIKKHSEDKRIITSFLLSTFLNNISKKRKGFKLFEKDRYQIAFLLLDIIFFIYAFYPSFEQTRKLISIISYINTEIDFKNCTKSKNKLLNIINRYSFIFKTGNIFDLCDLLPLFNEYKLIINIKAEDILINKALESNNPIIIGVLLIYSKHNTLFFHETTKKVENIIFKQLEKISDADIMMQEEFWYVLIFHNCPYISSSCHNKIDNIITKIKNKHQHNDQPSSKIAILLCDFLDERDSHGCKYKKSFFNWDTVDNFGEQITYRTYQRTIFKKYSKNPYKFASID